MTTNRAAQTFALIHLIEILLALFVFVVVAWGVLSMINGISFFEQLYARDTAHVLETLHAVPNGAVEYGYLWSSPNYQLEIVPGKVTVSKTANQLVALWKPEKNPLKEPSSSDKPVPKTQGSTKAFGTGSGTLVETTVIQPRYVRYSAINNQAQTMNGAYDRSIGASAQLAARGCTTEPPIRGATLASYSGVSDAVGQQIGEAGFTAARDVGLATQGLTVLVTYEASTSIEMVIIDKRASAESTRAACLIEQASNAKGTAAVRGSIAAESQRVQNANADIVIIIRGTAQQQPTMIETVATGLRALTGTLP